MEHLKYTGIFLTIFVVGGVSIGALGFGLVSFALWQFDLSAFWPLLRFCASVSFCVFLWFMIDPNGYRHSVKDEING